MSLKSFFDSSFFINLFTMPLKGRTWEKLVKQGKASKDKNDTSQNSNKAFNSRNDYKM